MQRVIGICGLKGSGKDTIAKIICDNDDSFIPIAFADVVKDICSVMFGWDRDMLSGRFIESREWREQPDKYWSKEFGFDFTPRKALTTVGTDIIRGTFLENIWDLNVKRKILNDPDHNFVITDCRFPNEIAMIKELGGMIVQVKRGSLPAWYYWAEMHNVGFDECLTNEQLEELQKIHPSERDWIGINKPFYTFFNNGTLEDLEKQVLSFFNIKKRL